MVEWSPGFIAVGRPKMETCLPKMQNVKTRALTPEDQEDINDKK